MKKKKKIQKLSVTQRKMPKIKGAKTLLDVTNTNFFSFAQYNGKFK